ncbi:hypothetical protein GGF32_003178 [Allomyces javanicus]|nr:hypothetical protein GGF32_003178 [Allomyces javanicus]
MTSSDSEPAFDRAFTATKCPELQWTTCSVTACPADHAIYVFGGKTTQKTKHPYNLSNTLYRLALPRPAPVFATTNNDHQGPLIWEAIEAPEPADPDSRAPKVPWPSPRNVHAACFWPETRELIISGGFGVTEDKNAPEQLGGTGGAVILGDVWAFQIDARAWRRVPVCTEPLSEHTMLADVSRGLLLLVGGSSYIGSHMVLTSLVTIVDMRRPALIDGKDVVAATTPIRHTTTAFRRRRHTAAATAAGLLVLGGRNEKASIQDPLLLAVTRDVSPVSRRGNRAHDEGIRLAVSARPVPALAAAIHDDIVPSNPATPGNEHHGHVRVFPFPAHAKEHVGVLSFPMRSPGVYETDVLVFHAVDGTLAPGVEPLRIPNGPHFALALEPYLVFLNRGFAEIGLVAFSRFLIFSRTLDVPEIVSDAHRDPDDGDADRSETKSLHAHDLIDTSHGAIQRNPLDAAPAPPLSTTLPHVMTVQCGSGRRSTSAALTVYPQLLKYVSHLRHMAAMLHAARAADADLASTGCVLDVPESAAAVRAIVEFGVTGEFRVPIVPANLDVVADVYHLAIVWCEPHLHRETCRWMLELVRGRAAYEVLDAHEDALAALAGEAHGVNDKDMLRVLAYGWRVWGVEVEVDEEGDGDVK